MRLIDADAIDYENIMCSLAQLHWLNAIIEQEPTIEAEPVKHGRWKYYRKQNIAVCTNCSFERKLDDDFGKAVSCPNCGAKMDLDNSSCTSYHTEHGKSICYGTKNAEECTCEGNRKNCNFYKKYREE